MAAPCVDAVRALTLRSPLAAPCVVALERVVACGRRRLRAVVASVRSARAASVAAAARYTAAWDATDDAADVRAVGGDAAALRVAYEAGDALTAALDAAGEGETAFDEARAVLRRGLAPYGRRGTPLHRRPSARRMCDAG